MLPAVLLGVLPGVPPAEVSVAVAVELPPCVLAALCVCRCIQVDEEEEEVIEKDSDQSTGYP